MQALKETNFTFPAQTGFYRGKVRDVYSFGQQMAVITTDRISAFDVVLPRAIPYKGAVLNSIAAHFLRATADLVPNWLQSTPHPMLSIGRRCQPYPVEMVVRGYLAGHAWRQYREGHRMLCGVALPEGLQENDKLPQPIITPTTKAHEGHDEDISREEIIGRGLVPEAEYRQLEQYALQLFSRGTEMAAKKELILVDTKYEFGRTEEGTILLIDEVHTPDSSRYFYSEGYGERQRKKEPQRQLSKEFVRQWLISEGFQGKEGQQIPEMTDELVQHISARYLELYEKITGLPFTKPGGEDSLEAQLDAAIRQNIIPQ
ncbi:phosphoribosylaminoimidazolesuccinocarboxamide synthase [Cesiribacter andamanensis]|uniref:Phosphoribosylaminoimidazole-succinocarboxamide synthase n=1 Tax=Cesiribacter andamanensis AMV16 TaxID=1279009 RepID=M7NAV0_9BACT|nr:phosphoribosylaminoimidazolesuccinocarboxamide synthase [Cesiribacter andamanensis]EMR04296.1 Phosphoribosylaminoimidazole-succinocarboxamide synthase [Cesiribacter andamanensis AMV16]